MIKIIVLFVFILIAAPAVADDCVSYKLTPSVDISIPNWTKTVVQPLEAMDLLHGNVVATFTDNYDIVADITPIEDGFCVALKGVEATVGYSDFLVKIDIRHSPDTCSYNAILSHEDEHIRSYLSVVDDYKSDVYAAVMAAANSVMPIFVADEKSAAAAVDILNARMQAHPDVVLVKQKIKAAEEIRNKRVDQLDDGAALRRCFL